MDPSLILTEPRKRKRTSLIEQYDEEVSRTKESRKRKAAKHSTSTSRSQEKRKKTKKRKVSYIIDY